jgi:hypothetical protein
MACDLLIYPAQEALNKQGSKIILAILSLRRLGMQGV